MFRQDRTANAYPQMYPHLQMQERFDAYIAPLDMKFLYQTLSYIGREAPPSTSQLQWKTPHHAIPLWHFTLMVPRSRRAASDLPPAEWPRDYDSLDHERDIKCRARSTSRKRSSASCVKLRLCWRRWSRHVAGDHPRDFLGSPRHGAYFGGWVDIWNFRLSVRLKCDRV